MGGFPSFLHKEEQMKTELLQIRLTKEFKEQIKELAAAENRTATNYIETLIKREIEKKKGLSH